MSMFFKVFTFGFIALVCNGFYTDIVFKETKTDEYVSEEYIHLHTSDRVEERVILYSDGRVYRKSRVASSGNMERLAGYWDSDKEHIYYSNKCVKVKYNNEEMLRCATEAIDQKAFLDKWDIKRAIATPII